MQTKPAPAQLDNTGLWRGIRNALLPAAILWMLVIWMLVWLLGYL